MFKTCLRAQLVYILVSLILIAISLTGIAFNVYEPLIVLSITSFFTYFVVLINLYSAKKEGEDSKISFMLMGFFRFLLLGIGLVLSALCIYFLNQNSGEIYPYLYLLLGLIPIFLNLMVVIFRSKYDS